MFILQVFKGFDIAGSCNKIHINNILTLNFYLTHSTLQPHEKYQPVDVVCFENSTKRHCSLWVKLRASYYTADDAHSNHFACER
jgi:hypothetical protein